MAGSPHWEKVLETAALIEGFMLQGYTTTSSLRRVAAIRQMKMSTTTLQKYIDAIQNRWTKGDDRQDRERKRAMARQQFLQILRESYNLLADIRNSTAPNAYSERNKTIANIIKTIAAMATLDGLNQSVHKIVGDPHQPVTIRQEGAGLLDTMVTDGLISPDEAARIDAAIIASATRSLGPATSQGQIVAGSVWRADQEPSAS